MLLLCSVQIDQFQVSNLRIEQLMLKFDVFTTVSQGANIFVSVNVQVSSSHLIFAKKFVINSSNITSIIMTCEDQVIVAQCNENLASLKKNLKVDITFQQFYDKDKVAIIKQNVKVDTHSKNTEIIIIASVCGAIFILLFFVYVIQFKSKNKQQPYMIE
ncbi:Hypothetical_protein [Hexamita inflata]|uniref:Hypothetical_protein n=1 Tax=Hexamita inflata TaxID=28002 RepID=A0AA86Q1Q5_9EUKA|nr:Hypothetical protein HINF_LOCUS38105 [Hexamita inflata]